MAIDSELPPSLRKPVALDDLPPSLRTAGKASSLPTASDLPPSLAKQAPQPSYFNEPSLTPVSPIEVPGEAVETVQGAFDEKGQRISDAITKATGSSKVGAAYGTGFAMIPDIGLVTQGVNDAVNLVRGGIGAVKTFFETPKEMPPSLLRLSFPAKEAVEKGGGQYVGIQRTMDPNESYVLFNDPISHSTFALPSDAVTEDAVKARLVAAHPVKSPPIEQPAPTAPKLLPAPEKPLQGPADYSPAFRFPDGRIQPTEEHGLWKVSPPGRESGFVDREGKFYTLSDLQKQLDETSYLQQSGLGKKRDINFTADFTAKAPGELPPSLRQADQIEIPRAVSKAQIEAMKSAKSPEDFWANMGYKPGDAAETPKIQALNQEGEKALGKMEEMATPPPAAPASGLSPEAQARVAETAKAAAEDRLGELSAKEVIAPRSFLDIKAQKGQTVGPMAEHSRVAREADLTARKLSLKDKEDILSFGIKPDSKMSERLFDYIEKQGEGLKGLNANDREKILRASGYMRARYDSLLNEVNDMRAAHGLDPIAHRADYVTHYNDLSLADQFGWLASPAAKIEKDTKAFTSGLSAENAIWSKFKNVIFNHIVRREGEPFSRDAISAFTRYSTSANRYVQMTPAVDELTAAADAVAPKLPNLAGNLKALASYLTGHQTPLDIGLMADQGIPHEVMRILSEINSRYTQGVLEANPTVPLAQFLRLVPITAESNPLAAAGLKAFMQQISPEARAFALANSQILRAQVLARMERSVGEGTLRNLSNWLPQAMDREIALWAWNRSYNDALPKLGSKLAIHHADTVSGSLLPILSAVDKPALLRGKAVKLIYPLMQEATVWANNAINRVWRASASDPEAAARMSRWVVATAAVNTGLAMTAVRHPEILKNLLPFLFPGGPLGMAGIEAVKGFKQIDKGNIGQGLGTFAKTAFVAGIGPAQAIPARLQLIRALEAMTKER